MGGLKVDVTPEIVNVATKAILNDEISTYISCRQDKVLGWTQEQIYYDHQFRAFLSTQPTPQQVIEYRKINPPPDFEKQNIVSNTPSPFESGDLNKFEKEILNLKTRYSYQLSNLGDSNINAHKKNEIMSQIEFTIRDMSGINDKNLRCAYQLEKYRYIGDANYTIAINSENMDIRSLHANIAITNFDKASKLVATIRKHRTKSEYTKKLNEWLDEIYAEDTFKFYSLTSLGLTNDTDEVKAFIRRGIAELDNKKSPVLDEYDYKNHPAIDWVFK
jgi:hypothetical protein